MTDTYSFINNYRARHCERSEAIQCTRIDCFTLRVRNDGVADRLHKSPCFLFALLKAK
jgi:hypothetical protein